MDKHGQCTQPDRDVATLKCGYPIPCPWHTSIIDTTVDPVVLIIPVTAPAAIVNRDRLAEIGVIVKKAMKKKKKHREARDGQT